MGLLLQTQIFIIPRVEIIHLSQQNYIESESRDNLSAVF